ncbi:MAG TPA: cysteine--tRNA ligase, partial [Treponema sp.]|nr:cysteine--tRNA ligase [Treponema sp.]
EFLVIAKDKKTAGTDAADKMSKSSGNFLTLTSLIDKGYDPLDYRLFLLGAHYRKQIYFSWEAMDGAKNARQALVQRVAKLAQAAGGKAALCPEKQYAKGEAAKTEGLGGKAKNYLEEFRTALENDLSTPVALSLLQKAVKDGSLAAAEALELVRRMDSVLGLRLAESAAAALDVPANAGAAAHADDPEAEAINALVAERSAAKKAKNFARSDEIRDQLAAKGIVITDTPQGPVWERR